MRKLLIATSMVLLSGALLNVTASPPVRDVGHVIVKDVGVSKIDLNAFKVTALNEFEYFGAQVIREPVYFIAPATDLVNESAVKSIEPALVDNPVSWRRFSYLVLNRQWKPEKIYLVNCSIKQCLPGGYSLT